MRLNGPAIIVDIIGGVMEDNALACSHCNMKAESGQTGWKKCDKCATLWCPRCAPVEDRCSNCVGGALKPIP